MNYGKLTAGTTKTAIDTAKPSEKGEIITYLSRMGDVLEHIADRGKLTFAACAVHAVIDGNEMNAKLRENNIGIHSHLEIIAPKAAHVLYDDALDPSCLDVGKHTLEARTVEVCAGITVILVIMAVGGNPVILAVAFQNLLLVCYGVTFTIQLIFLRKALIQSGQTFFLRFRR